jgi:hypothetical protein
MPTFVSAVPLFLAVLAEAGFLGAACLLEECLTTKNNPKDNAYLIKCFAEILKTYTESIFSNKKNSCLIFIFHCHF